MLRIENTIYINCDIKLLSKMIRRKLPDQELLFGCEFGNKKPTRNNIKISSIGTYFGQYKDWYFHINPVDEPMFVLTISKPSDIAKIEKYIFEVKRRNIKNLEKLENSKWLAIKGIGPKFNLILNRADITFEEWLAGKRVQIGNKKIMKALYKKPNYSFTSVNLDDISNI